MEANIDRRSNELNSCTLIKNVLMIIIVLYHTIYMFTDAQWNFGTPVEQIKVFQYTYYFLMPLHTRTFFMVSGYIYAFLKLEKKRYPTYPNFVFNKFKRLIVPYLIIGLLYVLPIKYLCGLWTIKDGLISILSGKGCDQLWFIIALFFVFVIIYPFDKLLDKHPVLSILIAFALMGLTGLTEHFLGFTLGLGKACRNIPFFVLGYLYRKNGTDFIRKKSTLIIGSSLYLLIFAGYVVLREVSFENSETIASVVHYSLFIFGSSIFFGLLLNLFDKVRLHDKKISIFLGKHSMNVYLFHQQIIYIFIFFLINKINHYLFVLLVLCSTLVIALSMSLLFRTNKVTKFMVGERAN